MKLANIIVICVFFLLVSCQSNQNKTAIDKNLPIYWEIEKNEIIEPSLKKRLTQYWENFLQRKWSLNYQMETPENKNRFNEKAFSTYYRGGWPSKTVTINHIKKMNETEVIVTSKILMEHSVTGQQQYLGKKDKWTKIDGVWYHHFEDPLIKLELFN